MTYTVLTLFPGIIEAYFSASIMARAVERGVVSYRAVNIRDFALDRHKTCDDAPYGGGPGMLMLPDPLGRALEAVGVPAKTGNAGSGDTAGALSAGTGSVQRRVIYLSPSGRPFNQEKAKDLAAYGELVLLCGRYEGIDQRIIDLYIDEELSLGDYVLSSGEAAALVIVDATYRLVDRVITRESLEEESFSHGLLEYPQYTRPEIYGMIKVPEILLSGHHENIRRWRLRQQIGKTLALRPDLIRRGEETGLFDRETRKIIEELRQEYE
ncbi:MAG: tRNA (guanosine(37)-N1)-methyltransferase TrmD [Treponema sp.]|jgi:tRNA (guanine37-N1)-methyltransferase|nr:tRNA (guanosine(37)-N1)-methyltransferase TrmD [Treponema sp.]